MVDWIIGCYTWAVQHLPFWGWSVPDGVTRVLGIAMVFDTFLPIHEMFAAVGLIGSYISVMWGYKLIMYIVELVNSWIP